MSTANRGSGGHLSNHSSSHSDHSGDHSDQENVDNNNKTKTAPKGTDKGEAWWSVGQFLDGRNVTHQSAKFTLTGNRVFHGGTNRDDMWDLTDSLMELYETSQKIDAITSSLQSSQRLNDNIDITDWLSRDPSHGFIKVYPPDMSTYVNAQIVPCTTSMPAHKINMMLGLGTNALHVQLNGDIIRRLDPYEQPLSIQVEYLKQLGYDSNLRIQQEGLSDELAYMVKFYSGKPMYDSTFSRNQLQAFLDVKKGKVMSQWVKRLCVVSGTRLLMYKDKYKRTKPTVVQLVKGSVEETTIKGHDLVLKLTATLQGEKFIYLSFNDTAAFDKWKKKCKKATDKLPTAADLSNCHLEFLPDNIFINDQLGMLNLRHNVLRERPLDEDVFTMGWIDDLPRFSRLRSLNLADNNLTSFPMALCQIKTLVELNLASNKLTELPPDISELTHLQALHIHNNHLTSLPHELVALGKLFILVLAFNRFTELPPIVAQMTDVRISEVENIIMAGNQVEHLPEKILNKMKYVKKVDLRMNKLTLPYSETVRFNALEHLTHLDVRDNNIMELDIRAVKTLEYLNVERNGMLNLQLNGMALKNLFAGHNELERFVVSPKPEWLLQINLSHNSLRRLPEWLSDCFFLQKLNASHNCLTELPSRIFVDAKKLKSLRVNHNNLTTLPEEVGHLFIEELHIEHNQITRLPHDLLRKCNKLRIFNATRNRISMLPPLNDNLDLNKVQELYLTCNALGDSTMEVVSGYLRLKVLNIAHNEIHNLYDKDFQNLEMLQELNLSGNQLRALPAAVGQLSKLVILRAHSNMLQSLPDFHQATSLKVLDVGRNQLLNVSVTNLMASQLNLLDMSLNAELKVNPREFKTIRHKKSVCLVDLTGQNRSLPGLRRHVRRELEDYETDPTLPWKVGFSETSGIRNKLSITTLAVPKLINENEALFGMFDGGRNNEVPKLLLEMLPEIIKEEMLKPETRDQYMKYTLLAAHKRLKASGQRLGASAAICHIKRMSGDKLNQFSMQLCNVGDVEIVMCRKGEPVCLTYKFLTSHSIDECERIYTGNGIITEDGKVSGTTKNTRLLGNYYLYPHVIPEAKTTSIDLRHDDEFIIIGNKGLWKYVAYDEAVEAVYEIGNPVVAAKKLQDLAQAYGSKENVGILVVRFNTDHGPSLARLRQHKSMSVDDVEAAAEIEAQKRRLQEKQAAAAAVVEFNEYVIPEEEEPPDDYVTNFEVDTGSPEIDGQRSPRAHKRSQPPHGAPELRPLPKQRFKKKNVAQEWDDILRKRLSEDVKDKELKQLGKSVSEESLFTGDQKKLKPVEVELKNGDTSPTNGDNSKDSVDSGDSDGSKPRLNTGSSGSIAWRQRMSVTPPWANQIYEENKKAEEQILHKRGNSAKQRPQSVLKTVAMFENMERSSTSPPPVARIPLPSNRTVITLQRDERSPLDNDADMTSPQSVHLATPTVNIQTNQQNGNSNVTNGVVTRSNDALERDKNARAGSVEGNIYSAVRKVDVPSASTANIKESEDQNQVTIVEIARL